MADVVKITAPDRYLRVLRADGTLLDRNLTVEDAIEAAVNAGPGDYRITHPDRIVKVYGTLPASTPPAAPTVLAAEQVTAGYVSLSWTDDGNGTSWTVYRDGVPIGNSSTQGYTDSSVVPSTAYSYQAQASNSSGSSELSAALAVTTTANSLPAWEFPNPSVSKGVAYSIDLNTVCSDADAHALTFALTAGSVPGLALLAGVYAGTPTTVGDYPLTFQANDGYAASSVQITFTVVDPDVTAPSVPTGVSASVNGSTVTVTWTASTDTANTVARYKVYRNGVFRANATITSYVESGVPVGTYSYTVSAVDSSANANESAQSSASNSVVVTGVIDTPINFTASAVSPTQINLSWSPGPNGAAPDDYDIDFSTIGASGPWTAVTFVGTATTYSHTGRSAATQHWYRIKADHTGSTSSGYATASARTLTAGQTKRWNPGHYIKTQGSETKVDQASYWAGVFNDMDRATTFAPLKGSFITVAWGSFNTTGSTYDWAYLDALFAKATSLNQKLIVSISFKGFEASTPGLMCPSDLNAANVYPTYRNVNGVAVVKGWITAVWRAAVMTRFIAAVQAFAAKYKDHPALESVSWSESAPSFSIGPQPSDYSNAALSAQLQSLMTSAVPMFPTSWVMTDLNSLSGQLTQLLNNALTSGGGMMTPDAFDSNVLSLFRGETAAGEQTPTNGDLRGRVIHCEIASSPVLGGKDDNGPATNVINWSQTNKVTHLCWVTSITIAGNTWADIQSAITADPLLHSAYPTG